MQKSMIKLLSIADIISLTNAIFGFIAIIMIFLDKLVFAFSFILLALLADGLDGIVARKTRKGELGEYMEAMADMISLCVAPALFLYNTYFDYVSDNPIYHSILITTLIVYLTLGVIRLASFHIIKNDRYFVGLPASASTIFILVLSFLKIDFIYIIPFIIVVSIVMVSPIKFPKIGIKINAIAAIIIILTIFFNGMYENLMPISLFVAIALYAFIGPIYLNRQLSKVKDS